MSSHKNLLSMFGVPMLGLVMLLICLWHPQVNLRTEAAEPQTLFLLNPDPRHDKSLTVFLTQEARNVARCRSQGRPKALAQTIADYNLIAKECTPAVFQATGLPRVL